MVYTILLIVIVSYFYRQGRRGQLEYGGFTLKPTFGTAKVKGYLEKYFTFYQALPPKSKKVFEKRVAYFISCKEFVPREMSEVSWEMKALISASAIQLTFGFPKVHLSYFRHILVYPEQFYSTINKQFHKGEVNPQAKTIVLGWKHFVEGYLEKDGRNLGLHEMAHALRLENRVMNHEYNFLDEDVLHSWEMQAAQAMKEITEGTEEFFRAYGATDREEFFAVAVENFFERPTKFSNKHPVLYATLCNLLRQDPKLLLTENKA